MKSNSEAELPSYSGRWVARVRGKVVAQGATRDETLRAAKASRPKEEPEIIFIPPTADDTSAALMDAILAVIPPEQPIHLVGGAVRDRLLGRSYKDLDFAVPSEALVLARRVANQTRGAFFPLDPDTDTARIVYLHPDGSRTKVDFAAYRRVDLESDLAARDFTINAISLEPRSQQLFDPLGGLADLREKRLRACSAETFKDDPVRILRAVRLAAGLGFHIQRETRQSMKSASALLPRVSTERLRDELFKMLDGRKPDACIRALDVIGALPYFLPELASLKGVSQPAPHVKDVWEHTLSVLGHLDGLLASLKPAPDPFSLDKSSPPIASGSAEHGDLFSGLLALRLGRYRQHIASHLVTDPASEQTNRSILFFAALYHDIAKPQTRALHGDRVRFLGHDQAGAELAAQRARELHLSNEQIARISHIISGHMRIHFYTNRLVSQGKQPSRKAIYRFFRDYGEVGVELCLLALADLRATYEQTLPQETWVACLDVCRILLENWWEKPQETVSPPALVNGNDLMTSLGISPGPLVGRVLEAVREAQATGELAPDAAREDAVLYARQWMEKESQKQ